MRDRFSPQAEAAVAAVVAGQVAAAQPPPRQDPPAVTPPDTRQAPPVEALPGPPVPLTMSLTVAALAALTVLVAVLPLLRPAGLSDVTFGWTTALAGFGLAISGLGLGLLRGPRGHRDVATRIPHPVREVAAGGFGYQWAQRMLVVRPALAVARMVAAGDETVIDTYVQAPSLLPMVGRVAQRVQTGVVTGYLSWLAGAAVAVGVVVALVGGAAG
jgi:NADH-quinone oxidoreductase subunit L